METYSQETKVDALIADVINLHKEQSEMKEQINTTEKMVLPAIKAAEAVARICEKQLASIEKLERILSEDSTTSRE